MYKLAGANGSVLWHVDDNDAEPPDIMMLGSDVLVVGSRDDAYIKPIHRLSGTDGSVLWSSNLFADPPFIRTVSKVDDGHIIVFGTTSTTTSWAKLDATTGTILWTRSVPSLACNHSACMADGINPLVLSNGDIVTDSGFDFYHASYLRRFRNDGSGVVDDWNPVPSDPTQYIWINRVVLDSSGNLRLYLRRGLSKNPPSVHFLATFNMKTGSLTDQQALVAYANDPSAQRTYPDLLKQVATDRYVVSTSSVRPPLPSTEGVALLDTSIRARGDLAVVTTLDPAHVMPGATTRFHIKATYTGDQPLVGAILHGSVPWQSGITGLNCAAQASTCTIGNTSGNVNASFDIQPGGSIEVSGDVTVLDSTTIPTLSAMVSGPIGLSEQDTRNNFTSAVVTQSLFFDGFESH